ncbi:MAG: 7TM diverse intracellular signaling domain-containing protein [Cytophagaceae bacterium]
MKKILVLGICLILSLIATSERLVHLNNHTIDLPLQGDYLEIFEDTTNELSIAQIAHPAFNGFKRNKNTYAYNKNPRSAYWIKFKVSNYSSGDKVYFFETYSPHTDLIQIYVPDGIGGYIMKQGGENFKFHEREYVNKNLIFTLPVPDSNNIYTYYIRVVSKSYSSFNFRIKSANYFIYYITNEYYILGLYYGILLIMAVYNLLMFFSIREKVYIFYVIYVAAAAIITMTDDGLGFQYLWAGYPQYIRLIGYHYAPLVYLLAFSTYALSFMQMWNKFRKQAKILLAVTGSYIFYYGLMVSFSAPVYPILYTIPFITTYFICWQIYLKGYKPARLFLFAFSLILLSIIVLQLRAEHIIQGNIFTVYILYLGHLTDVVIFSYALADRVKIFKKEKEDAQKKSIEELKRNNTLKDVLIKQLKEKEILKDKVNKELEQKVTLRTIELNEKNKELEIANIQLKALNQKVNEMNVKLDLDNWHLKKDLREGIKARVADAEVPYEQFLAVFPDESTCYRYLEELKWKNEYKCRKCRYGNFSNSSNAFTRKCSRCGYVESATAYTIFHGIKFPINKAFYITYLVHRKGNMISSEEIAQLLNIGKNTSSKFKKKVQEEIEEYKKKYKNKVLDSWEEIII